MVLLLHKSTSLCYVLVLAGSCCGVDPASCHAGQGDGWARGGGCPASHEQSGGQQCAPSPPLHSPWWLLHRLPHRSGPNPSLTPQQTPSTCVNPSHHCGHSPLAVWLFTMSVLLYGTTYIYIYIDRYISRERGEMCGSIGLYSYCITVVHMRALQSHDNNNHTLCYHSFVFDSALTIIRRVLFGLLNSSLTQC